MIEADVARVSDLIKGRMRDRARTLVAIAGPPASGKSTLAEAVVRSLNNAHPGPVPFAALLPMDGYHLDNRLLTARGLLHRKGAPETFDAAGFTSAVRKLRVTQRETFYPAFDRSLDLSIANAIAIHPDTPVIVVEGNYLLLNAPPWASIRDAFSVTVFVSPPMHVLKDRLVQRWIDHGLDAAAALRKTMGNDLPNAERVIRDSGGADMRVSDDDKAFGLKQGN